MLLQKSPSHKKASTIRLHTIGVEACLKRTRGTDVVDMTTVDDDDDEKTKKKIKLDMAPTLGGVIERFIREECDYYLPSQDRAFVSFQTKDTQHLLATLESMPYYPRFHGAPTTWAFTKVIKHMWKTLGVPDAIAQQLRRKNCPRVYFGVCLKERHCSTTPTMVARDDEPTLPDHVPMICLVHSRDGPAEWYTVRICLPFVGNQWHKLVRLEKDKRRVRIHGSYVPQFTETDAKMSQPLFVNTPSQACDKPLWAMGTFDLPLNADLTCTRAMAFAHECRLEMACRDKPRPTCLQPSTSTVAAT